MFRRLNYCSVLGYGPICLDSNDPLTVSCGLQQRLLRNLPTPDEGRLQDFELFVRKYVRSTYPHVQPMSFEEWIASTTYDQNRKAQLRESYDQLRGGFPSKKACSHIDTFVKTESYEAYKHARTINSRSDAFKVFSGPAFKAIENVVYNTPGQIEFIKHVPVPERPNLLIALKKANRRYFSTDFTAFESHFTSHLISICEGELYRWCLSGTTCGDFIVSTLCGYNKLHTRTGIRTKVKGRRMSGDMCTSLGNGFTNMMLAMYWADRVDGDIEGYVEGDDGLFSTSFELTPAMYGELGFTIKIEEVADPCHASFCGMLCSESAQIIRNPRKFFMTFAWTSSFISAGTAIMDELLHAKALSCLCETPHCPIVAVMAHYALARVGHVKPRFVPDGYHLEPRESFECFAPTTETRALFEDVYGISVETQLRVENMIRAGRFDEIHNLIPPTADQSDFCARYITPS